VAEAAFRRLVTGDYPSLKGLAGALGDAAARRNIIFWSSRPAGERPAAQLHADGSLPDSPDFADLTVQNLTGNKLDYYLDTALRLTGKRPAGTFGNLTAQVTITNAAPKGGRPAYVFGPYLPSFQPGEYDGLVNLYLPRGTSIVGSSGLDDPGSLATEGESGRTIVAFRTVLQPGESRVVTLNLRLAPRPPGPYRVDLAPVPRVRPTAIAVDIDAGDRRLRYAGFPAAPVAVR
jgi:hypothetical protein